MDLKTKVIREISQRLNTEYFNDDGSIIYNLNGKDLSPISYESFGHINEEKRNEYFKKIFLSTLEILDLIDIYNGIKNNTKYMTDEEFEKFYMPIILWNELFRFFNDEIEQVV